MVKVINILKDGTVVEDMSKVTVPADIVEAVADIWKGSTTQKKKKPVKAKA